MEILQAVDVLLVEDNAADAEMVIDTLRSQRLANQIEWLQDGRAALDYLTCSGPYAARECVLPKLMLLDLKLPGLDGLDVLRAMKADARLRHVPVVMLTASTGEADLARSYDLGVNGYVVKPLAFEQFSVEVGKLGIYWLLINHAPLLS